MSWQPAVTPHRPYKMFIWYDTSAILPRWRWQCGMCRPVAQGATSYWNQTLANAARHCRRRSSHHEHVARTRGWG